MFSEPTITWVPSGFSGYIWFDTKIVLKKNYGQVEHCDVCLIAERIKKAFVPCGHSRLCDQCIDTIMEMEHKNCPTCRAPVNFVLHIF